ncbi:glycosyltransferase family 2 protein [Nocardioides alcanivorans]|uniref:glycosyltransferase family 2 protein n=1 Tax=Nocardioides alcanivorans TaxID=2897352 RepID=UPI001F204ECB|nr:glycosyltransferase family 2 protein [Nocardioides alcanivorans]
MPEPVDVVVTTRNRPELLREALAAIRAQDHAGVVTTHVVFDGCAADHSVADSDPMRPVRVLTNLRTPGLAGGRNTGIEAGSAPYVAFCDDDDLWRPDKLSRQVPELVRGHDTVVSGITVVYADHEVVRIPRSEDLELATLVRRRVMEAHPPPSSYDAAH